MQQEIRDRLIKYVTNNGIKFTFISNQTGISMKSLSRFKTGSLNLGNEKINRLINYLNLKERNICKIFP